MKLPNPKRAIVERDKIENYLLDASHPDNSGKADFFERFGFYRENWENLSAAFLELAREAEVSSHFKSPHGQKYVIIGRIQAPSGKTPLVKTIWIVDKGADVVRLVTAYPWKV